jgi:hypothetical protein
VSLEFDKNFLFPAGRIGEAPLHVNNEFGRKMRGVALTIMEEP